MMIMIMITLSPSSILLVGNFISSVTYIEFYTQYTSNSNSVFQCCVAQKWHLKKKMIIYGSYIFGDGFIGLGAVGGSGADT